MLRPSGCSAVDSKSGRCVEVQHVGVRRGSNAGLAQVVYHWSVGDRLTAARARGRVVHSASCQPYCEVMNGRGGDGVVTLPAGLLEAWGGVEVAMLSSVVAIHGIGYVYAFDKNVLRA